MRHRVKRGKFSRNDGQRRAVLKSILRALLVNESITTTVSKAKAAQPHADSLIHMAKTDTLHRRRQAFRLLQDRDIVKKLFEDIAVRLKDHNGGSTRVLKLSRFRKGDGAQLGIFELLVKKEKEKKKTKKKKAKAEAEKPQKKEVKKEFEKAEKREKPPKGKFKEGIRKIFKKERDAL